MASDILVVDDEADIREGLSRLAEVFEARL